MGNSPVARVADGAKAYDSADIAARAALSALAGEGEQAGVVVKGLDGKFYVTDPITNGDHDHFNMRVQFPHGWQMAGVYHTHPGDDAESLMFSPNDLQVAQQLKVPSYIKFQKDGAVRRYTPGVSQTFNFTPVGGKFASKVARGDELDPPPQQQQPQAAPAAPAAATDAPPQQDTAS